MIKKKVPTNLIMCDLYAYTPTLVTDNKSVTSGKTYKELQVIETADGIKEQLVDVDYPITSEYVASFEQSANYKNDVDGAIAGGISAKNLGDVTEYQKVLAMDTELISNLAERLKLASEQLKTKQMAAVKETETAAVKETNNG